MNELTIFLINIYRKIYGFFCLQRIPLIIYPDCKFYPTCSEYGIQAVKKYGALNGLLRALWRVLRCNPWSMGGIDEIL